MGLDVETRIHCLSPFVKEIKILRRHLHYSYSPRFVRLNTIYKQQYDCGFGTKIPVWELLLFESIHEAGDNYKRYGRRYTHPPPTPQSRFLTLIKYDYIYFPKMNPEEVKELEVFPQTPLHVKHFAEFGDNLPQKLKSGVSYFLLHVAPPPDTPVPEVVPPPSDEEPAAEPTEGKKRRKRKNGELCGTGVPEQAPEPPVETPPPPKKKKTSTEETYKLYMKAARDGVMGKKGELIEALKIPAGTLLHLVQRKKYVKTMIYYDNLWWEI